MRLEQQHDVERPGRDRRDRATSNRQGSAAGALAREVDALALESTPRYVQPSSAVMNRPGPATPQHRSSTVTPVPMPARTAERQDLLAPA